MPHVLVIGMTESGKTTLGKRLAAKYRAAGRKILVLDPIKDPGWKADYITDDPLEYWEVFRRSQRCACFLDEAGETCGHWDKTMIRTATRGRHFGHNCHYLVQRGTMISPHIRGQCSNLALFASPGKDSQLWAAEWNKPQLANASELPKGHYYWCGRFGEVKRGRLF